LSDTIAATAKPKATKRSAKSKAKYTRDELEKLNISELRKQVTTSVPIENRNGIKPNFGKKDELIDLLMNHKA
jgi:hypothetical protein